MKNKNKITIIKKGGKYNSVIWWECNKKHKIINNKQKYCKQYIVHQTNLQTKIPFVTYDDDDLMYWGETS